MTTPGLGAFNSTDCNDSVFRDYVKISGFRKVKVSQRTTTPIVIRNLIFVA